MERLTRLQVVDLADHACPVRARRDALLVDVQPALLPLLKRALLSLSLPRHEQHLGVFVRADERNPFRTHKNTEIKIKSRSTLH